MKTFYDIEVVFENRLRLFLNYQKIYYKDFKARFKFELVVDSGTHLLDFYINYWTEQP